MKLKVTQINIKNVKDKLIELSIDKQDYISIPAYDTTLDKKPKFNRAKVKVETKKRIEEEYNDYR